MRKKRSSHRYAAFTLAIAVTVAGNLRAVANDFALTLIPESNSIAPYQPIRFTFLLKNLTTRSQFPDELPGWRQCILKTIDADKNGRVVSARPLLPWLSNIRPTLEPSETYVRHVMQEGPSPFADGKRYEDEHWPLSIPGKYKLQLVVANSPEDRTALESNVIEIEVRTPTEDEQEIGVFLRLYLKDVLEAQSVRHGNSENRQTIQALLKKYPESSLADELRYYLWWETARSEPFAERLALIAAIPQHKTYLRKPLVAMAQTGAGDREDRDSLSKLLLELLDRPPTVYSTAEQERLLGAVLGLQRRISKP